MVFHWFRKPASRKGHVGSNPTPTAILRQGYGMTY